MQPTMRPIHHAPSIHTIQRRSTPTIRPGSDELQRARKNLQPFLIGLTLAAIATAPGRLHAQEHMMAIVNSDRIVIGSNESVPRRTDLSSHLIVPAGATVELDAASTFDYIEIPARCACHAHATPR